jgi:hypothetical protein
VSAPVQTVFVDPLENLPVIANSEPTLSDILTIEPTASIFFSYAREIELGSMLSDRDRNISVLVPTNKAVMALARKPQVARSHITSGLSETFIVFL